MKIKDGFILREIADSYVVVPVGQNLIDFSSMMTTNETGAFLWNELQNDITDEELCQRLLSEYAGISPEVAASDIKEFTDSLKKYGILE